MYLKYLLLFLLLFNCGCALQNQMILHQPENLDDHSKDYTNRIFSHSSFYNLARIINDSAPEVGSTIYRTGSIVFRDKRVKDRFNFNFTYTSAKKWTLRLLDHKNYLRVTLNRSKTGFGYRDVLLGTTLHSNEDTFLSKRSDTHWQSKLPTLIELLIHQGFDPSLDWQIEKDGLKYMIIARVEQDSLPPRKHQLYLHKKTKVIGRHMISTQKENIVRDVLFSGFKEIGSAYLPSSVAVKWQWKWYHIDISIDSTTISSPAAPMPKQFKSL